MNVFKIIFWVTLVETFMGHLPPYAPLIAFGVIVIIAFLQTKDEKTREAELQKILEDFKKKNEKK